MSHRPQMLASVVRDVVALLLPECPPSCGIVTITEVEVSSDGSYATVYLSALRNPEEALDFFIERMGDLRSSLSKSVSRRRSPILRFRIDPRSDRGARIDHLLDEA